MEKLSPSNVSIEEKRAIFNDAIKHPDNLINGYYNLAIALTEGDLERNQFSLSKMRESVGNFHVESRTVLLLCFGLNGKNPKSLAEISILFCLEAGIISKIKRDTLKILKNPIRMKEFRISSQIEILNKQIHSLKEKIDKLSTLQEETLTEDRKGKYFFTLIDLDLTTSAYKALLESEKASRDYAFLIIDRDISITSLKNVKGIKDKTIDKIVKRFDSLGLVIKK